MLDQSPHARMSEGVLEQHIRQYIEAQTGDEVVFSWQGGEPTLMGIPFFERVVELQKKYAKQGQKIARIFAFEFRVECWSRQQESNLCLPLRRQLYYPLYYGEN